MLFQGRFFKKEAGEKIIIVIRHHWWILTSRALRAIFLSLIPPIIISIEFALHLGILDVFRTDAGKAIAVLTLSLYYLLMLLLFLHDWINYHLDLWIITDRRVVDVEQRGILSRVVAEHRIERIQDVSAEVHGFAAHCLHFGDLHIQTAGEQQKFVFEAIPQPQNVIGLLNKLVVETRKHKV